MSFIDELLELISTVGGIMPHYKSYPYRFGGKPVTFYKSLERLEQRKLIMRKNNKQHQEILIITAKGQRLLHKPTTKTKRADGFSTIVTFDIPEEKRKARNTLRRYLIRNGFTLIQKSLLISPNKVHSELIELIQELKIKPFVKIISGKIDYII